MKIEDANRSEFLADRNKFLTDCYGMVKEVEFKSVHASDEACKRMRVFCLNHINSQIGLLKRTNAKF